MLSICLKFLHKCHVVNFNCDICLICMFHYVIWELWNKWNIRTIEIKEIIIKIWYNDYIGVKLDANVGVNKES